MKLPSRILCKTLGNVQNDLEAPRPLQMKLPSCTLCKTLGNVQITWEPLAICK